MEQHFKLTDGTEFDLKSWWTADVVKEGNSWKLAAFHVSADLFNNPILGMVGRKVAWVAGGGGVVVGILLGIVGATYARRKKDAAAGGRQ
jgi:hypothetical protein